MEIIAAEALQRLWQPMKHRFDDLDDERACTRCGARALDAAEGPIGCEAPPEGNTGAYHGFALTPVEQALGVTQAEKAKHFIEILNGPLEHFHGCRRRWQAVVEDRALARFERRQPRL